MSNTPRTDALLAPFRQYGEVPTALIDFARQLERENFMLRELGADLRKSAEMIGYVQSGDDWRKAERRIRAWDTLLANVPVRGAAQPRSL